MKKSKSDNLLIDKFRKIYAEEYGKTDIKTFTELENNLYNEIVLNCKDIHELELQTKAKIELLSENNVLSSGSLILSFIAICLTCCINWMNAIEIPDKLKTVRIILYLIVFIASTFLIVDKITNAHISNRNAIYYYKLKLQCIEKVKKEMEEQKTQATHSKSTKKSKKH